MKIKIFCHSLLSDWNHGNAHFLRGVMTELVERGHTVEAFEPFASWSLANLIKDRGPQAIEGFHAAYPQLNSQRYELATLDLDAILEDADLVLVHEWNSPELITRIGLHHKRRTHYRLLFHDTHHRSVTAPAQMAQFDLSEYDGVLAFGEVIRRKYLENGWSRAAWTWHEAADVRVFHPKRGQNDPTGDLVWVGNWGDDERTEELYEFLLTPVAELGLNATVFGVRYPSNALNALSRCGLRYGGSVGNYEVPALFGNFAVTVHVPRRPYVRALPGIPTIRVFEALACGIPLVSAPWRDEENLFRPDKDFLFVENGEEMSRTLRELMVNPSRREELAKNGLETILNRHTCAHRVNELFDILAEIDRSDIVRAVAIR